MSLNKSDDEEGYDFTKWADTRVDCPSFFSSLDMPHVPADVYDKDLYLFFLMVQRLGVTLTLSDNYNIIDISLLRSLIPLLEEAFQGKKINKILLKGDTKCEQEFRRIAAIVETD